jgi:hypothetical protein
LIHYFFKIKSQKIAVGNGKGTTFLIGNYATSSKQKNDFILHSNSMMEFKNEIPLLIKRK